METGSPKSEQQNLMYRIINIHRTSNNFSILYLDRYIVGDFFFDFWNGSTYTLPYVKNTKMKGVYVRIDIHVWTI